MSNQNHQLNHIVHIQVGIRPTHPCNIDRKSNTLWSNDRRLNNIRQRGAYRINRWKRVVLAREFFMMQIKGHWQHNKETSIYTIPKRTGTTVTKNVSSGSHCIFYLYESEHQKIFNSIFTVKKSRGYQSNKYEFSNINEQNNRNVFT